jgi:ABC-type multidrug transport system ATPase subunit
VLQDDTCFAELTVRETILFSARLRLPESISSEEKQDRVEQVIAELGE